MLEDKMLTEDDVVLAVRAHLEARGWTIVSQALAVQRGDDLVAVRDGERIEIEAKGEGSSKPSSSRFGNVFSSSQVNDHVGRALLRALKVVSLGKAKAAVAFPDNADHRKEVNAVRKALDQLGLAVFLVGADKKVSAAPDWCNR
jgi:hypothetical protein